MYGGLKGREGECRVEEKGAEDKVQVEGYIAFVGEESKA